MKTADKFVEQRRERATKAGRAALDWYGQQYLPSIGCKFAEEVVCHDPSHGSVLWSIPNCGSDAVEIAADASREAQRKWMTLPPSAKGALLNACADAIEPHAETLAELLALETGKSLTQECRTEVGLPVAIFRYFAGLVHEVKGKSIQAGTGLLGFTTHHPWGVVGGIVPWNVPLMFMAYKVAAPLAAGNSAIVKMPEQATASLIYVLRLIENILPKGLVIFLSGDGSTTGAALVANAKVDKVSFTGSVETGREISSEMAKNLRSVTLELGGKSPMIILDDCDIDKAISGIIGSMRFTRAGQSCTAASRIYVPRQLMGIYKRKLKDRLDALRIGDALDETVDCGPVVTSRQRDRIMHFVNLAKADGLDVQPYGKLLVDLEAGYYVMPILIFDPDHKHPVSQEEIFGPVATISPYDDLSEVIVRANDTRFGLSASVWGKDINKCLTCANAFRAGIVQINQNAIMLPGFSYGGVGISGVGKESSLEAMIETYMYEKTNIVNYN